MASDRKGNELVTRLLPVDPAGTGMPAAGLARAEQLYPHHLNLFTRHGVMEIYRAMVAAAPDPGPTTLPHNFTTRRESWRTAIEKCIKVAEEYGDADNAAYWKHELAAYDTAHAELIGSTL